MAEEAHQPPQIAPPSATGGAGPQFEAKVGAFYALSLLSGGEPRGVPGATIRTVEFQQRVAGHPLDDIVIKAINRDGSAATLEIQVKRSLTFTLSDGEFRQVVGQIWEAAQRTDFESTRYGLAAAIARTTTRIERACQEVLHWARQVPDGATFAEHIGRPGFASNEMREFVEVFRANLALAGAPTDDETVWRLLRRFQILVFDFESPGSDYEHRARERAGWLLSPDQADRAADLWSALIEYVGDSARAAGAKTRPELVSALQAERGYRFGELPDVRPVYARLAEEADHALGQINETVGGVRLARNGLIGQANASLETHRILHIQGAPGVGKSSVMKHLAARLQLEGRILVLRSGRIVPGGWLQMAHIIGWTGSLADLFNELGCGGGATLVIDNVDQIDDSADWATVSDLLTEATRSPGWRVIMTGGAGNDDWKTRLSAAVRLVPMASLSVGTLSDEEKAELAEQNGQLAVILAKDHPAKSVAENLFYLSRMIELGVGQDAGIATELDLAQLWWRYGGGRSEDDRRFARLKLLRAIGTQVLAHPSRIAFNVDDLDPATVPELLRLDSLREEIRGSTVAFRHDVLRDWTIGFLLRDDRALLAGLPSDKPMPTALARGLEIAARLTLADDPTGKRWLAFLKAAEAGGLQGSWRRPILLALPRSENSLVLFVALTPVLLESVELLREIIRLMLAVESEPLVTLIARVRPDISLPMAGANDLVIPKGLGWMSLVLWLVHQVQSESLPTELIPDVVKAFQAWLIATQNYGYRVNAEIVGILFDWLALLEGYTAPRTYRSINELPADLKISHVDDVRNEIRMIVFTLAHLNPDAAARYLSGLDADSVRYHDAQSLLRSPGTLPEAAPAQFAAFALAALIEKDDPDRFSSRRRGYYGPFEIHEHVFLDTSSEGGPFLGVLKSSPVDGLKLVRGLVEHATDWRRDQYREDRIAFPRLSIPFPGKEKSFEGDLAVYRWARSASPSLITTAALRALEIWGHQQIEAGRPFEEVLDDILGPDGSSVAFVAVAVDIALSHWKLAANVAWPMIATPELLQYDEDRFDQDIAGLDRLMDRGRQGNRASGGIDLDALPSRRTRLVDKIGRYVFGSDQATLASLRTALAQACERARANARNDEDPIDGLRPTAERALRMTDAASWAPVTLTLNDGTEAEVLQYQPAAEEQQRRQEHAARATANLQRFNTRLKIQAVFLERQETTADFLREAIEWAKAQQAAVEPEDADKADNYDIEWNRRAVVIAAALVARDYEGPDRDDVLAWARPILEAAPTQKDREYLGNSQVEYNTTAVAALGIVSLFLGEKDAATRDLVLNFAGYDHPAVLEAVGRHLADLGKADERIPRSIVRIIMARAVHPRRPLSIEGREDVERSRRETIDAAIDSERHWLNGEGAEPSWPELAPWRTRPRRRLRLPDFSAEDDEDDAPYEAPSHFVDERALGTMVQHLIGSTIGEVPAWIIELANHLMAWSDEANGPHGEDDRDRDNRPYTWNMQFFHFAGILSVALPHAEVVDLFLDRILKFKDEAFHDVIASFLRGYDGATLATDIKDPENPAGVRASVAERIKRGWNYRRLGREKGFMSETHAGDALNAMFYQPHRVANTGRPTIPANWPGLQETMATLTDLVVGAPTSGYLASLFLNLVESSHHKALVPFVAGATDAWCKAYGIDRNFWAEKNIGSRVCAWFDAVLSKDTSAHADLLIIADNLFRCLDILVQSGVAHARLLEDRITNPQVDRKAG